MAMRPDYRERQFVLEYLADAKLNGTQAAIRAGYSPVSAGTISSELLQKPQVRFAIQQAMDERAMRTKITVDTTLVGIARLALSDIRRLFNPDGTVKPIDAWDNDIAMAVQSIKVHEDGTGGRIKEIRLADKARNLELLARHLGLLTTDKERGDTISDLLKAVLLEMRDREDTRNVTPEADWVPLPPTVSGSLPAPPDPYEDWTPPAATRVLASMTGRFPTA